jgi:hypothetical protein
MKNSFVVLLIFSLVYFESFGQPIAVKANNKYIYIDEYGNKLFNQTFASASNFSEGLGVVRKEGQFEYIDRKGNSVFSNSFDIAFPFMGKFAVVGLKGDYYIINLKGEIVSGPFERPFMPLNHGNFIVKENNDKLGVFGEDGVWHIPPIYSSVNISDRGGFIGVVGSDSLQLFDHQMNPLPKIFTKTQVIDEKDSKWLCLKKESESEYVFQLIEDNGSIRNIKKFDGEDLYYCKYLGNDKVYLPKKETERYLDPNVLYSEYVYNTVGQRVFPYTKIKLDTTWINSGWATIGNKYFKMPYENQIESYQLFDKVISKDENFYYDLVNKKGLWYVWDERNEKLIGDGFEFVEETTRNRRSFIIKEYENGSFKYGMANYKGEFLIVPKYEDCDKLWKGNSIKFYRNDSVYVSNLNGKIIWKGKTLEKKSKLNLSYRFTWSVSYKSSQNKKQLPREIRKRQDKSSPFSLVIANNIFPDSLGLLKRKLYFINNEKNDHQVNSQDNRLDIKLQGFYEGKWHNITHFYNSWCGNSYYPITIPGSSFSSFNIPVFEGVMTVPVRAIFTLDLGPFKPDKVYVSNSVYMSINPGQLWFFNDQSNDWFNKYIE